MLAWAGVLVLAVTRSTALQLGVPDLVPAAVFGGVLLVAAANRGIPRRPWVPPRRPGLLLGAALGVALLVPGAWMRAHGAVGPGAVVPDGYALAWVLVIALISAGEEMFLRGWLQPLARQAFGPAVAIAFVAAVFASMHAPLYGWIALPLDLGVGILVGCLREYSGGVAACILAHFLADLGHWWLP